MQSFKYRKQGLEGASWVQVPSDRSWIYSLVGNLKGKLILTKPLKRGENKYLLLITIIIIIVVGF